MDFGSILIIVIGALAATLACRGLPAREQRLAMIAFGIHVMASVLHWSVEEFYYGISDSHAYVSMGSTLTRLLDGDPVRYIPEVLKLALHLENDLPFESDTSGTGTMGAIAGFFVWAAGPSLLSLCLITTWISWFGQLCLYRVARKELPSAELGLAGLGFFFVPSVIFWGAGYAKESIVLGFFGLLALSSYNVARERRLGYVIGVIVGGVGVAVIKPYTLFPYVLGLAAFVYADRAWRGAGTVRIRPIYLVLAAALALGGLAALGSLFPQFGAGKVAESISVQQELWQHTEGGSTVEMGDAEARSLSEQLRFVPLALVNAFFRPTVFEARNATVFGASVEAALLTLGVLSLCRRSSYGTIKRAILGTPLLVFSVVFVIVFAAAVGLATSNLGSLSRYRVPMMPFYATTILVLRARVKAQRAAEEKRVPRSPAFARRSRLA